MPKSATSAASLGLLICHSCGQLSKAAPGVHEAACARCGAHLHVRKPDSIARTWAFLIAAVICYIPANVLPVMETGSLFGSQSDTIMSGVIYLWTSGSWPLALLIFFASITVPEAAAREVAESIRRVRSGLPPLHRIDPRRGY